MPSKKIRLANAVLLAAVVTVLFVTTITIQAEFSKNLKDWLAHSFGHHWVGKGILALGLFAVLTTIVYEVGAGLAQERYLLAFLKLLFGITILGTVVLTLFFIWHFLKV